VYPKRVVRGEQIGVLQQGRLAQMSTPEEIYTHHLATPFVARFTRLPGELLVQVRRAARGSPAPDRH
jgi:ABC-type sugar transport system ATPase subunit